MRNRKFIKAIFRQLIIPILKAPFTILKAVFAALGIVYRKLISKLRFSITFRITTVYVFIITLVLLILSTGVFFGASAYLVKNAGDELQRDSRLVSAYMEESAVLPVDRINKLSELSNVSVTLFDDNKKILYSTEKEPGRVAFIDKSNSANTVAEYGSVLLISKGDSTHRDINVPAGTYNNYGYALVLNENIKTASGNGYIQIIDKISEETMYAGIVVIGLVCIDMVFILLIMLIGSRSSKKILKPVYTMTETVKSISVNQLDTRLDISGSQNELKDLARTFNNMLERLQKSYEQQNQFVSDASHELRTPISVIQGYVNLLDRWGKDDRTVLEEAIAAIKAESENMKSLIEKLLFLARSDRNTQKIEKTDFPVNELIDEIIKETKLIDNAHEISAPRNENIMINADRSLIKEALRIFTDNSVKYTPEGGKIKLECFLQDNNAVIAVEDTGIGISKEDIPFIFNRFYRADKSRTKETGGTGLGLAIAKWIILKHNGTIRVQSEINHGTKISISLPVRQSENKTI